MNWAKKQLEDFAGIFRKQVYTSDVDPMVVEDAVNITFTQSKKVSWRTVVRARWNLI